MCDPATLNSKYSIPGHLDFGVGSHGAVVARIANAASTAEIAKQGAQLLTWAPAGQPQVVWLSPQALFKEGKSLRGGAPVCWPWFGPHPSDATLPGHGYARNLEWRVKGSAAEGDATRIGFFFDPVAAGVPNAVDALLELEFVIGATLRMELTTTNRGSGPLTITQALHTYFHVGDIGAVTVDGLEGKEYVDKVAPGSPTVRQQGGVAIGEEVDRIYLDCPEPVTIVDAGLRRRIRIANQGSRSCVVWNPWADKGAKFGDMGDDGYRRMLCVETTNAGNDQVAISPGARYTLATEIGVAPL